MTQFYSYLWLREDGTPYYAGKGAGNRAFVSHKRIYPPRDKSRILIFSHVTEVEAFESEKAFIKWFGRKDIGTGCLHNLTDGGEGKTGRIANLETRRRMSEAQKGNKKCLGHKNMLGRHHTEVTKARMADAHRGQKTHLGCRDTVEQRARKRVAQTNRRLREIETNTHCTNGHPLTKENCIAYLWFTGHRKCLTCAHAGARRYHLKKKEASK